MGTDIRGWIEVRYKHHTRWGGTVKIHPFLVRHYDMLGCLFGVRNYAGFKPVVELRGMPADISKEVENDFSLISHSQTWITWKEIAAINWDEQAEKIDERVRYYQRNEQGEWQMTMKVLSGYPPEIVPDSEKAIQIGDTVYKVERMTRRDALKPQWEFLFKMMETLATHYDENNVRLTVWFDS